MFKEISLVGLTILGVYTDGDEYFLQIKDEERLIKLGTYGDSSLLRENHTKGMTFTRAGALSSTRRRERSRLRFGLTTTATMAGK